jgi:hypothetical protein
MPSMIEAGTRSEKIARSIVTKKNIAEFREHLKQVVESAAFRGSHRSAQFLTYICEQTLTGQVDSLKERLIGAALFGRPPAYDTGEDAIVRVTASDVRKRLTHYYLSAAGSSSDLRIHLPVGSYVPEFTHDIGEPGIAEQNLEQASEETSPATPVTSSDHPDLSTGSRQRRLLWFAIGVLIVGLGLVLWAVFKISTAQSASLRASALPWSVLFADKRVPLLITSDPNIAEIQGLTGQSVSVSDYANQIYVPNPASLSPEINHIAHDILRGDKAASVDTPIVAGIAELAARNGSHINVFAARELHFSDLDTDGNAIFLGSPRTDPWTSLFDDQVDFRFFYENASRQEIIKDAHPHHGEPAQYVPTAKGFATGQSFAIISFIRNPNHTGNILMLAGANAEGTKAAGKLITNLPNLSSALRDCGIRPTDTTKHFQMLLHLNMMAGSPTAFDVVSCHILP